jgi:hypothetical protein
LQQCQNTCGAGDTAALLQSKLLGGRHLRMRTLFVQNLHLAMLLLTCDNAAAEHKHSKRYLC